VRDPRDVALSLAHVPFGAASVVADLVNVAGQMRRADTLVRRDPRTTSVRFEDLLADPTSVMRQVCDAVGVPFDPAMIERRGAEGIAAPHEWWKAKAAEPLDPSRAGGWRTTMDPAVQRFAAIQLRDALRAHGYPDARDPRRTVAIVPLVDQFPVNHEALLLALAADDTALADPHPRTPDALASADDLVFWGQPGQLGLDLGRTAADRTVGIVRLAALLAARRAYGRPATWIRRNTTWPARSGHPVETATASLLRALARKVKPGAIADIFGVQVDAPGSTDE